MFTAKSGRDLDIRALELDISRYNRCIWTFVCVLRVCRQIDEGDVGRSECVFIDFRAFGSPGP